MATNYDVIVVGAGPGGATAARGLARAGLRTLLLEKDKMPRYKACGGGLTRKVQNAFGFEFAPVVEDSIGAASVALGPRRMLMHFDQPIAWDVMRSRFDQFLAEEAERAGAEVLDATPVTGVELDGQGATVRTERGAFQAPVLVGADGVNGVVRRAAGFAPPEHMFAALEAEIEPRAEGLEQWRGIMHFDFGAIPWGYAWIFPKAGHLSVGLGAFMRPGVHPDLRRLLARYVESEPSLQGGKQLLLRGHRIPLATGPGVYHHGRALLVGDAAGLADPFTAEGIYFAMQSGAIAAAEIAHGFERDELDLSSYTRRVNVEINHDAARGALFANLFYRAPGFYLGLFHASENIQATAAAIVSGELGYRQAIRHGLDLLRKRYL